MAPDYYWNAAIYIGRNIPVHSVGILPHQLLSLHPAHLAQAMQAQVAAAILSTCDGPAVRQCFVSGAALWETFWIRIREIKRQKNNRFL